MAVLSARNRRKVGREKSSQRTDDLHLLVYGFRPYLQFATNITAQAIKKLAPREGLKTVVFPVRFNRAQFVQTIKKHEPDVILGLGQCSSGVRFRIERRALNRRCTAKGTRPVPIDSAGPKQLVPTLRLDGGRSARISRNAGTYVCNYSMYVILDYLRRNQLPIRFGFIHIPCGLSCTWVARYLESVLDRLQVPFNSSSARRRY